MQLRWSLLVLLATACERPAAEAPSPAPSTQAVVTADACRRDIPDCAAACSLRETGRLEHIDWFDRRCAAVVLGKNPDKVVGTPDMGVATVPTSTAATTTTTGAVVPSASGTVVSTRPEVKTPYDPFAVSRQNGTDPPECVAARRLIAKGLSRDAQALAALCEAKGGDAGAHLPTPDSDDPFATRH